MTAVNQHGATILVLDDEQTVLEQAGAILAGAGYQIHSAQCGERALELLQGIKPDLLIVDVNLAGHSGIALVEQWRQQVSVLEMPVMYLSAAQGPDVICRRTRTTSTTDYYLRKPFDAEVLLSLVEKAMTLPQLAGA